ncbi:MAG: NAD-dependent epimerase/dehydratase family protein, partial [Ekhidna sp.]
MTDSSNLSDSIKTVLITGGTGLVGTVLSKMLTERGFKVTHLSRNPTKGAYETFHWDIEKGKIDEEAITSANAIIHLAGAGVADKRWSDSWKKAIYDSRINSTRLLRKYVE